jgi:hypothetical protein
VGTDHAATQQALGRGLHALADELGLDPHGALWQEHQLPFTAGAFNLGRACAYRSMARALAGEDDPDTFPDRAVEVEIDPDRTVRWRYREGHELWTRVC